MKSAKETDARSREVAYRQGQSWEDWEDEFVLADNGLTRYQKAIKLERPYSSVSNRIQNLRKSARAELVHND